MVSEVVSLFNRMHVLVIGPGLGRCPLVFQATAKIITAAIEQNIPLVIDADGLFLLTKEPYRNILLGYENVVLTPNVVEMKRLIETADIQNDDESKESSSDSIGTLSKVILGNILVRKGKHDIISSIVAPSEEGNELTEIKMECKEEGGLKRSGGIGDVLSGTMGAFVAWNSILSKGRDTAQKKQNLILSCWSACCLTKKATRAAFQKNRRSMTAPDILEEIGSVFDTMTRYKDEFEDSK